MFEARLCVALLLTLGCGRLGYDGGEDSVAIPGAAPADASGPQEMFEVGTCPDTAPICPVTGLSTPGSARSDGDTRSNGSDYVSGSCGGAGAAEGRVELLTGGTFRITARAGFDVVLYVIDGCDNPEQTSACVNATGAGDWEELVYTTDESDVIIVDSADGLCGTFELTIERLQ